MVNTIYKCCIIAIAIMIRINKEETMVDTMTVIIMMVAMMEVEVMVRWWW